MIRKLIIQRIIEIVMKQLVKEFKLDTLDSKISNLDNKLKRLEGKINKIKEKL